MRYISIGLCLARLVFGITSSHASQSVAGPPEQTLGVRADEIGTKVQVIGRLGKPMATMMTVRGVWRRRPEGPKPTAGLEFHVTEVDNHRLPQPVVFLPELIIVRGNPNVTPEEDAVWELRAFETGQFRNIEAIHWREFSGVPVSPPDWGQQSVFVSELTGIIKSVRQHGKNTNDDRSRSGEGFRAFEGPAGGVSKMPRGRLS